MIDICRHVAGMFNSSIYSWVGLSHDILFIDFPIHFEKILNGKIATFIFLYLFNLNINLK